jgi:hypothetical protein
VGNQKNKRERNKTKIKHYHKISKGLPIVDLSKWKRKQQQATLLVKQGEQ